MVIDEPQEQMSQRPQPESDKRRSPVPQSRPGGRKQINKTSHQLSPKSTGRNDFQIPEPQPGCSKDSVGPPPEPEGTPTKYLKQISPIPRLEAGKPRRGTQRGALVLTSEENINALKTKIHEKEKKEMKKKQNENAKTRPKVKKRKFSFTSDSDSDGTLALEITSEISEKTVPHKHGKGKKESLCSCKECKEFYHNTKKSVTGYVVQVVNCGCMTTAPYLTLFVWTVEEKTGTRNKITNLKSCLNFFTSFLFCIFIKLM